MVGSIQLSYFHYSTYKYLINFRTNEVDSDAVVDQTYNVIIYSCFIGALFISAMARSSSFFVMCMRSSVNLHNRIFYSLLRAPIHVFDSSPVGLSMKSLKHK